ncbi:KH domain-containing protein At4g18375-like isoform X1 [Cucurbita maxima]|uniref:KH domain-containing protein At4g18375-like isoform X1 n=1 Tax=Cucurbita maxima TaxID=3661 RepID=A0A6J1IRB7_CUCMA|nr:KH domain-containing protein At4g18375-like isoform X1 [Cucurbita maxima]
MVSGKRSYGQRDNNGDNKSHKRRITDQDDWVSDELVVYRILCPDEVIGSVIGKSGKVINSIRQETRAKIKVVDPFPGAKDRVITIFCFVKDREDVDIDDEFNDRQTLCAAQDALLKIHAAISNALASAGDLDRNLRDKEQCQVLIPSSQSANVIGKAGSTIKKLRSKTRTSIRIIPKDASDPIHSCAMEFDNFVMIAGDPDGVRRALFAISSIMYKFPPREEIPLDTNVNEAPPSIIIPSDVPLYSTGGLYPSADPILPPRSIPPMLGAQHVQDLHDYPDTGNAWPLYSSALPMVSSISSHPPSEELVVRLLCPLDNIGRVIGKGGGTIKSIRQASGACVEVDDSKRDCDECLITISSFEYLDDLKSMAVETVLLLQEKINDDEGGMVIMRLLVPSKVIGCIIGKSGSIINEIRKSSRADIRISKGDKIKCAAANDELVEVTGNVGSVRDALVQIVLRLRDDALKERDVGHNLAVGTDSMYSSGSSFSMPSVLPSVSPGAPPMGYDQRAESGSGLGALSSSSIYGYGSLSMGDNGYGSMPSYSSKLYGGRLPPPSSLEMLIPANAAGKVIGKGGANIANIRKISGALIEISDSKSSRGDRIALISGTSEQKRTAENLIQAFIMAT